MPLPTADTVAADHVCLVLDRPRLQQRHPVQSRRASGQLAGTRYTSVSSAQLPELVGEAQVVAHEQRDPQALDVDRDELGRRRRKCLASPP